VLSVDPGNQTMNRIKAYSLYESGDYAGASAAMDNYLKVTPADKIIADDYAYQGRIFAKTGKFAEAAAAIDKAIAADPTKEDELQIDRANIYLAQGNYSKAGDVYQQRLKSGKGDLTDQFRYAGVLGSAKKYAQADSVYNIISTEKPTYGPAYLYRGRVNVNRDPDSKQGLAKPYYEKYIELAKDPAADQAKFRDGLIEANSYLGYYNLQKGDKAAALPYYEQVLALDPANVNANKAVDIIKGKTAAPVKKATAPAKKK
jgi:tetratricopeptide (TPR) repeat protein